MLAPESEQSWDCGKFTAPQTPGSPWCGLCQGLAPGCPCPHTLRHPGTWVALVRGLHSHGLGFVQADDVTQLPSCLPACPYPHPQSQPSSTGRAVFPCSVPHPAPRARLGEGGMLGEELPRQAQVAGVPVSPGPTAPAWHQPELPCRLPAPRVSFAYQCLFGRLLGSEYLHLREIFNSGDL